MNSNSIGMLVELDFCVGCYACQSACQDANKLPVKETYLRCILAKPEVVDGDMQCYMSPIPYDLGKCGTCIEREGEAPCSKICIGKALHFGTPEEIHTIAEESPSRISVFF